LISDTLNSVKNQSFTDFELIIVDDGSTDNTRIVVENYISNNQLKNWHFYSKINGERGAARNFGLNKAIGKWITFLDSDDLFYPNHLYLASNFISKHKDVNVFHSAYEFRNQKNELIRKVVYPHNDNLNQAILNGNVFSCFGMFLKSDVFNELCFEENRNLSGSEDWLLWLKVSARYKIYFQSQISGCMVQHDERSVLNFIDDQLLSRTNLLVAQLNHDEFFFNKYGRTVIRKIHGHMFTYSALHLLLSSNKSKAIKLFFKGYKSKL
jgi:glycosyltransferase involved in cell wall biosynthesis